MEQTWRPLSVRAALKVVLVTVPVVVAMSGGWDVRLEEGEETRL